MREALRLSRNLIRAAAENKCYQYSPPLHQATSLFSPPNATLKTLLLNIAKGTTDPRVEFILPK